MELYNKPNLKIYRKNLRKAQTKQESVVWNLIRNRKILNIKFYRQYSIGKYILDFYSPQIKLAIEIDGGQHNGDDETNYDFKRTDF